MATKELDMNSLELGLQASVHYFETGREATQNLLYGEDEYRNALLVAAAAKMAVLAAGPPGTGKTVYAKDFYRGIEGLTRDDVADIPIDSTLTEKEIVGGTVSSVKTTELERDAENEGSHKSIVRERSETTIDPILTPNKSVIFNDELNRKSHMANNALLGAPEEHKVSTNAGSVELPNFLFMVSTMNPSDTRDSVLEVSPATASRHGIGAIVGFDLPMSAKAKLANQIKPQPSEMKPFVTLDQLNLINRTIESVRIPQAQLEAWIPTVDKAQKLLYENVRLIEAGRMYEQVGRIATTLAVLTGTLQVKESHWAQALRYGMASRIGARIREIHEAPAMLNDLHGQAIKGL